MKIKNAVFVLGLIFVLLGVFLKIMHYHTGFYKLLLTLGILFEFCAVIMLLYKTIAIPQINKSIDN